MRSAMNSSRHAGRSPASRRTQQSLEPVEPLHRMRQVAMPRLRGAAEGGGELRDRELRDLGAPLATQRQQRLVPLIDRADHRLHGVHQRPPHGRSHHLSSLVVLGRLVGLRSRQHTGGVIAVLPPGAAEIVEVMAKTNSTTDHRHSRGVESPLWTRDSGPVGVDRKWLPALAAEVSRRSLRDLLNHRGPQAHRRRQPR